MKKSSYKSYLTQSLLALTVVGGMTACAEEAGMFDAMRHADSEGLSIKPTVSEARLVTRAASVEELNEKALNTLDVFVEHVTDGNGDGTFLRQYHLVGTAQTPIQELMNNFLAERWRAEGLEIGQNYNIYVATNNTRTKDEKNLETFNVEALKGLVADEVTDGLAVVDGASNNIAWPWIDEFAHTPSGNIYKQYVPESGADAVKVDGNLYGFTTQKEFMMDGIRENWTPDAATLDQVFDNVTLNRAAAKIVLNVKFDADFLKSLTQEKNDDGEWVDKPADEQISIINNPAWRFYNFAFGAPVFAPETQGDGVEVHNSATLLRHPYGFAGDDKNFQIITYSYPNKWDAADYATKAPSLVISVPYKKAGEEQPEYGYYRIPLVKSDVTAIERNHIYVINATIATRGSELHEDEDVIEDVQYAVLPWNDESNSAAIHNEVDVVQHLYLKVNPKVYTLRGDDDQSVVINYLKAAGTEVGWKLFTINTTTEEKGEAVESTAANAVWGWFYDKNGNMKTSYSNWNHMRVTIEQSDEGTSGSKGTVTVTSTALDNRAIKYMLLRVYLKDSPNLYEDVLIRHFPTDNIQSFTGSWSSYHTGISSREDTWDPVAAGWEEGTYASEEVEVSATDPNATAVVRYDGTPTDHDATDYRYDYTTGQNNSTVQTQYRENVNQGNDRRYSNSENNAVLGDDGYWYWGTTQTNGANNNWDWRTGGFLGYNYYRWTTYHRSKYKKTHYVRTRYYRLTTVETPETGNWVDWDRDHNHSGTEKWVTRSDDPLYNDERFDAHVWSDADGHVHTINSSNNNMASQGGQTGSGHTNNHMYVVQISATSDKYVLGKPILGNPGPNQSLDDVVSPAFMIASQLGVVSTGWNAASAAEHCRRYLEVGTDGYRYAGWRLPTADEIEVISDYQGGRFGDITIPVDDRVMDNVLKGSNYFNLSGGTSPSNYTGTGGSNGNFLRCVRDLSAEEIDNLNGFDKLIEKYLTK